MYRKWHMLPFSIFIYELILKSWCLLLKRFRWKNLIIPGHTNSSFLMIVVLPCLSRSFIHNWDRCFYKDDICISFHEVKQKQHKKKKCYSKSNHTTEFYHNVCVCINTVEWKDRWMKLRIPDLCPRKISFSPVTTNSIYFLQPPQIYIVQ